jgi:hypothetical protein
VVGPSRTNPVVAKPITIAVSTSACGNGSAQVAAPSAASAGAPTASRPVAKMNRFTA